MVNCTTCTKPFCAACLQRGGHPGLTCDENKARDIPMDDASREAINGMAVQCPWCTAAVSKTEGCNKMTCRCGQYFCYTCGEKLDHEIPYAHFCSGEDNSAPAKGANTVGCLRFRRWHNEPAPAPNA